MLERYELSKYNLYMYQCLSANTVDLFNISREVSSGGLGVNENKKIAMTSCLAEALERYCMSYIPKKEIIKKIKKITDTYRIPLVINDNIDIAIKINADGIHIGQGDISCLEARKILGNNKIIGVTVSNLNEAKEAISKGATYLGVGAIYKSNTKKDAIVVGEKELKKIAEYSTIPVVVIGGINKNTIPMLKGIKIDGYAMISPILTENNIAETTKKLKTIIDNNKYVYQNKEKK